jgi:hypothetical protein
MPKGRRARPAPAAHAAGGPTAGATGSQPVINWRSATIALLAKHPLNLGEYFAQNKVDAPL